MLIPKGWRSPARSHSASGMGITKVDAQVSHWTGSGAAIPVTLLVDSGASYSVLPASVWQQLGLVADEHLDFTLADGTTITRGVSECRFSIGGRTATSPVVLGRDDEGPLLGTVTLETLRLVLNPLTRRLMPMRLLLASMTPRAVSDVPASISAN
jgi:predicted aspartyl protease